MATVRQGGPDPLRQTRSALTNGRDEILAFFPLLPIRISHGLVQGKKTGTKALMRQASGSRNRQHRRLRILRERVI